jgi:hypothetical protein
LLRGLHDARITGCAQKNGVPDSARHVPRSARHWAARAVHLRNAPSK